MIDRRTWLGLTLALALVAVFAGYYLVHKPLTPAQAVALGGTLLNVAVAAGMALYQAATGHGLR